VLGLARRAIPGSPGIPRAVEEQVAQDQRVQLSPMTSSARTTGSVWVAYGIGLDYSKIDIDYHINSQYRIEVLAVRTPPMNSFLDVFALVGHRLGAYDHPRPAALGLWAGLGRAVSIAWSGSSPGSALLFPCLSGFSSCSSSRRGLFMPERRRVPRFRLPRSFGLLALPASLARRTLPRRSTPCRHRGSSPWQVYRVLGAVFLVRWPRGKSRRIRASRRYGDVLVGSLALPVAYYVIPARAGAARGVRLEPARILDLALARRWAP